MKKLLFFFVALLSLVVATPAANAKRSIMELPPFERAVLIIKKFGTNRNTGPMLATVTKSSRGNLTAVAYSSPKDRLTPSCAKTSENLCCSTSHTAKTHFC